MSQQRTNTIVRACASFATALAILVGGSALVEAPHPAADAAPAAPQQP